ncbi:tryptophan--tRNA ligase [Candidatus Formimonas warabiya]|uniref:Tryptophan--tRNA ligase n=1 Tax=Formimonas warabiya TaxID=1761012 RepID=A0A3G1KNQ0_FORW1|nr:tryptophan--tRNA ligase [Candidatus Formimonas warabiya]ATW24088.1 tryptophan--tRNA ligase [Candidatus Formimonas warabiya]
MKKGVIFSGMRPTGKLHLGHLSVLENWVRLQKEYECYYGIVDWHALTTGFEDTTELKENIREMAFDWLSVGIDPEESAVLVQSDVKEHGELHLLLSMITPVSWLERVPTYKEQINQFGQVGKDISTYGFLGYPLLMAADILVYRATAVPVGEDQLPHLELTREIARRFNNIYQTGIMTDPQAILAKVKLLPGIDNRKMSKSYGNDIALNASTEEIHEKVSQMVTDPARIRKTDLGHPEICTVHTYHTFYNEHEVPDICARCTTGQIGCVACKKQLAAKLDQFIAPIREKRAELAAHPEMVEEILQNGAQKAREKASQTMELVREAMRI